MEEEEEVKVEVEEAKLNWEEVELQMGGVVVNIVANTTSNCRLWVNNCATLLSWTAAASGPCPCPLTSDPAGF